MDRLDIEYRGVDLNKMTQWYHNQGIDVVIHHIVEDQVTETYADHLFQGAKHLYDLIDVKGHRVFLHCCTGVSRAPTLWLCYQALYQKNRNTVPDMDKELKNVFPLGSPNLQMVQKVLDDNQEFVNK